MIQHFLITRFNIKNEGWWQDKNHKEVLNDAWLRTRIALFKDYCLPSVLEQTCKKFKWLIIFQNERSEQIEKLLKSLEKHDFIEAIFVDGYKDFLLELPRTIQNKLAPDSRWVITSRLDNDDAIEKDYICILRKFINFQHNCVVHFPYGLCLDLGRTNRLAQQFHPLNQFISLVEDLHEGELKTVYVNPHNKWQTQYNIHSIRKDNLWLQVTHSGNVMNEFGGKPAFRHKLKGFAIKKPSFPALYNVKVVLLRLWDLKPKNIPKKINGALFNKNE